jgi:GNAT superfamily N-acetyltransferase
MKLSFETITEQDIPEPSRVMTRAFDDDARRHMGTERGGPPGYDNGDFFRRWLFGCKETDGWKVMADGTAVGGIIVWILPHGDNILGTIFIDPDFQDRGIGSAAWKFIEESYPQTRSRRLTTPKQAVKNHFFCETKCGFRRVKSDRIIRTGAGEYMFAKEMKPAE